MASGGARPDGSANWYAHRLRRGRRRDPSSPCGIPETPRRTWMGGRTRAPANPDQAHRFAKELIALRPDVLVGNSTPATAALLCETDSTPIVFVGVLSGWERVCCRHCASPTGRGYRRSLLLMTHQDECRYHPERQVSPRHGKCPRFAVRGKNFQKLQGFLDPLLRRGWRNPFPAICRNAFGPTASLFIVSSEVLVTLY